ncbi:zinc-binding dehydrogenase [Sinomonas terrae]|uniref:Zinc-binding dehydrogenase n=1 Tax=Sinomonas terrae TaxID=2908838 RepID=A0ABS9U0E5_9MICC|nr:zinc-binding dehydrogenase [Sinomonas terrae]MCH6470178.1 zinc-binding dehydrogenase [Sinomonas terrae]
MKAVIAHGEGDLRVEPVDPVAATPGNVLVRVVYGGICGSDLHYAKDGRNGAYVIKTPLTLGHEVVGVVHEIGPAAETSLGIGARVAIHPARPTPLPGGVHGAGFHLIAGGSYLGSASTDPHTQGGFVELLAVAPEQLRELPEQLPLRRAALAEPLAVALHGIGRLGERVHGANVLVSGAGPIGCLAIIALRAAGAGRVVAADLQELPLQVAREVGADDVVRLGTGERIEPGGFDVVLEAAGAVPSLVAALDAVRPGGAVLQLGMLPAGPLPIPMAGLIAKEVTLFGSQRFDVELDASVELLANDPRAEAVITHVFGIDDAQDAFACASDSSRSSKVLINISEDPEK